MIVWLASYPRSGNTFMRMVIGQIYGRGSRTVYPVDGVRARLGGELVATEQGDMSTEKARASSDVHFVKTHRRRALDVADDDRAIYLVRDGRDAVVSFARQRAELCPARYRDELRALLDRHDGGTASWGQNVLSWRPDDGSARAARVVVVRFEELIEPCGDEAIGLPTEVLDAVGGSE